MTSRRFDPRVYRDPRPSAALIHALGPVNRHFVLRGLLHLQEIDFPAADVERLRSVVNAGTAAFLAPNHPEFFTDWMLDKEISRRVSPRMAHWAAYDIVNQNPAAQWFWLRNNLIANAPGGGGKEYSVRWAIAGHGVLLHPEGTATWQGDRVSPLVSGIVDMAWQCRREIEAAGDTRPVFVAPVVWKLHFKRDVGAGLHREMSGIERALGLPSGAGLEVGPRFATLLRSLLLRQSERLGFAGPADPAGAGYFDAQARFASFLRTGLEARYGTVTGDSWRVLHVLRRAIRARADEDPDGTRDDRRRIDELTRLVAFDPALYDRPALTQEQIAENLKRIRSMLMRQGFANALHNLAPVAVGPRVAHIRVPESLAVHRVDRETNDDAARAALLTELRRRMQESLDRLGSEIAPVVAPHARPNPLSRGAGARPD
jgi:hypothetical protein